MKFLVLLVASLALWMPRVAQEGSVAPEPAAAVQGDTRPFHCRVTWSDDPAGSATISWSTVDASRENVVLLSTESRGGSIASYERTVATHRDGPYSMSSREPAGTEGAYFHHALLTDLEPGSTVWFVLRSDGQVSRELHFRTATVGDESYALLSGSDSRTGHADRRRMNRLMATMLAESPEILALNHGGDYVFDGLLWNHWRQWLADFALTTTPAGRVLPIIPTRGNHDVGPLYDEVFDSPGGTSKNWYTTRLGLGLALVTLNTNVSLAGDQETWLNNELASLRKRSRWMLASYHRPAFPANKRPGLARVVWVPLFESYDMDLVIESDGHVIKRTPPIRDETIDPTGVIYIGEGGLGAPQRVPRTRRWYLEPPGFTGRGAHLMKIDVGPEVLRVRTLGYDVDEVTGRSPEGAELRTIDELEIARRPAYPAAAVLEKAETGND